MTHTLHPQVISDMAALFAKARRRMDRETPGWNVALGAMEASELETIARQEEEARVRVAAALAAHVASFVREYPDRAAWWEAAEARVGAMESTKGRPSDNAQFSKRYSRAELRRFMDAQGDWALSTEGALCQADGGECMA